ncbi:MAG: type II toxin-antitoxin system RelE/ParE family toxin [Planctomycetota bacterium]
MTSGPWTVFFTATAEDQARQVAERGAAERSAAPTLFLDELEHAIDRLSTMPGSGAPFRSQSVPGVRRVLLPGSRYHVYYSIDEGAHEVLVRAIWHGARGHGPSLG